MNQSILPIAVRSVDGNDVEHERKKYIAFGEALRAMSLHCRLEPDMTSQDHTGSLLERTFEVLAARKVPFSPEDFAIYFLSRLLDRVDPDKREDFRRGAARYLVEKRGRLSAEFRSLAGEAQELLDRPLAVEPNVTSFEDAFHDEFRFNFGRENNSLALLLTDPVVVPKA